MSSESCWHDPIVRGGLVGAGVGGVVGAGVGAGVVGGRATVVVGFGLTVVVVARRVVVVTGPPDLAVVVVALPAVVDCGAVVLEGSGDPATVVTPDVSGTVSELAVSVLAGAWEASVSAPEVAVVETRLIGLDSGSGAEEQATERTARAPTRSVVLRMSEGMAQPFLSASARISATDAGRRDWAGRDNAGSAETQEWQATPTLRSRRPPSRSRCNIVLYVGQARHSA